MHSAWLRNSFLRVLKFLQIKEGGPNFLGEPILQKVWIIWSPLLYFNFKSFKYRISSSFIRFQSILHDSGVLFSESSNFYKLKRGDLMSSPFSCSSVICDWSRNKAQIGKKNEKKEILRLKYRSESTTTFKLN